MRARLILPLVLLSALGCSHLKGAFHPIEGENFTAEKLDQIDEGTPVDEVLRLLGEPLQRQPSAQGEQWRYYVREERVDELRFLGLLPVRKIRWERRTEARITVVGGRVAVITHDSEVTPPG